jgi:hypothetical protein
MAEEQIMMGFMGAVIGLTMAIGVINMYAPTVYTCHLCGAQFSSLAELQAHFDREHPGEPIDIEWG